MRRLPLLLAALSVFCLPLRLRAVESGPAADETRNQLIKLSTDLKQELDQQILGYWLKHSRNPANSAFYGYVDGNNKPDPNADRGALLTARILWTFSAAYRHDPRPEYLEMARYAYADLQRFFDREHGGLFWSLKADGTVGETIKEIYLQTFGIYGLSEYYLATKDEGALTQAKEIYALLDKHAYDPVNGGYFESFATDWSGPAAKRRSIVGLGHAKSQNTNLHVLECLTQLLRVWPDPTLRSRLRDLIFVMRDKVVDKETHHLVLFADAQWKPAGDECSYGHDIEFSWLLTEAAEVAGGEALVDEVKPAVIAIVEATLREGVDTNGGIFDSGTFHGGVVKRHKEWWPQAEALVGFVNAYQLTGDPRYVTAAMKTWNFIETDVSDRKGGEWLQFSVSGEEGRSKMPKISMWKCPYHNGRACMEVRDRVAALTSGSAKH